MLSSVAYGMDDFFDLNSFTLVDKKFHFRIDDIYKIVETDLGK